MTNRVLIALPAIAVAMILLAPAPAQAQAPAQASSWPTPRGDVLAGVAFWNEEGDSFTGFHLTGTWRPTRHVGIVGDLVSYGETTSSNSRTTLMGGVRVQSTGRHSFFGQVLIGSAPLDDIAIQPGAGVDFRLSRRTALRAAFDFKISGDDGNTYYGTRLSIGVAFLLGGQ